MPLSLPAAIPITEDEPLAARTTWGIGGRARYFAQPRDERELAALLGHAERKGLQVRMLGGGSNLLVGDAPLDCLVVRLHPRGSMAGIQRVERDHGLVVAGAGTSLQELVRETADLGLAGMEDLVGIPGTLGAAVCLNAGNPARGIGSMVQSVEAMDLLGRRHCLERDRIHFSYRWSNIADLVITRVTLLLRHGDRHEIAARAHRLLEIKRRNQPLDARSAGCVFKNPPARPAAQIIDELGLKGFRAGNAQISDKHANFIVNRGRATAEEVLRVIGHVRRLVRTRYGIELKLEIKLWV